MSFYYLKSGAHTTTVFLKDKNSLQNSNFDFCAEGDGATYAVGPENPHSRTCNQTWDSKMTSKIFIDMAASFWFFSSFLAKSISFYFRNQIYTALGFQKYSHCNKVLYISPWTIPFYTSDVSLLTKKSLIFAIFYKCESGVLLKYEHGEYLVLVMS